MKVSDLVRCLETDRVGVVLEIRRAGYVTMILVKWENSENWVDAVDLETIRN